MTAHAGIALRPPSRALISVRGAGWVLPLLGGAVAVGALATIDPIYATVLVLAIGLVLLVAANVSALTVFLILTMFTESLALGPGLRIGRLAGVMALVVLLYWMLIKGAAGLRPNPLLLIAFGYGLWLIVSGLWATSGSGVASYFTHWALSAAYMLTFAVLVRTRKLVTVVFTTLAFGALIVGAMSFLAYLSHGAQYLASGTGAVGLQGDHNYFAVYQTIALPAALTLAALERRRWLRTIYYAAVAIIGLSVVASLSRTGLFALVGVVVVTLLVPSRFFFRRRSQKLSYVMVLVAAAAVVSVAGSTPFLSRVQSIWQSPGGVAGHAGSGRIDLWRAAWHAYTQHPVLGLGAGNFQAHSIELLQQTPGADTSAAYALNNFVVHNMYLETLTDLGPVGLMILFGLLGMTGVTFLRVFRRSRDRGDRALELCSIALLVSLVAYCIGGFFLSIEFNKPLWILVGLALAFDVMSRAQVNEGGVQLSPAFALAGGGAAGAAGPPPPDREPRRERPAERVEAPLPHDRSLLSVETERLQRLQTLLAMRELRLQERERAISSLEHDERAAALAAREQELDNRDVELGAFDRLLAERKREMETLAASLEEKAAAGVAAEERAAALELRLQELEERSAVLVAREQELERREAELKDLEDQRAELERARQALAARERGMSLREQDLERRLQAPPSSPAQPVIESAPIAAPVAAPPLPQADPVLAPAAATSAAGAPAGGAWTLQRLEQLVADHRDAFPDRAEEWGFYLLFLRDHADVSGRLARSFDSLVDDVFEQALDRDRSTR